MFKVCLIPNNYAAPMFVRNAICSENIANAPGIYFLLITNAEEGRGSTQIRKTYREINPTISSYETKEFILQMGVTFGYNKWENFLNLADF